MCTNTKTDSWLVTNILWHQFMMDMLYMEGMSSKVQLRRLPASLKCLLYDDFQLVDSA